MSSAVSSQPHAVTTNTDPLQNTKQAELEAGFAAKLPIRQSGAHVPGPWKEPAEPIKRFQAYGTSLHDANPVKLGDNFVLLGGMTIGEARKLEAITNATSACADCVAPALVSKL